MIIKFTYVDAQTLRPLNEEPASSGPIMPALAGLVHSFSNESEWPCDYPIFYGNCDDTVDIITPGILGVLTQEEYDLALSTEQTAKLERTKNEVRGRRSWLLQQCDWTQLLDAPISAEKKELFGTYRQKLRDVTSQDEFPLNIVWPIDPDAPTVPGDVSKAQNSIV